MPLIQLAICIGLCVFSALCWQYCTQSKRRRLGLTIRARDWLRIGTITECVRADGIPGGRKKLPLALGFKCAYCGGEFGSRSGIDCHRRHRNSIGPGTPCADPMNSRSMSLTQRGDSYTGNLRLHDTLGVCTLVLPHHVQTLFCHFATRTLWHHNSCNNVNKVNNVYNVVIIVHKGKQSVLFLSENRWQKIYYDMLIQIIHNMLCLL